MTAKIAMPVGLVLVLIVSGCSTVKETGEADGQLSQGYQELYSVYPASTSSGISAHLVRSHTTAVVVRPVSSTFELGCRAWWQVLDFGHRFDVRFIRFPLLDLAAIPEIADVAEGMDLNEWERYLEELTGRKPVMAEVQFLIDGEAFYQALESAIIEAEESVDLLTYLFDNDDVSRGIADLLRERSHEVEVRIICDGLGTYMAHHATAESQPADTEYIENLARYLCQGSGIRLRISPNIWLSGNHVKCIVFDRKTAFIGGMNIGREYRYDWHDMMMRVEGDAVHELMQEFERKWKHSGWGGDFNLLLPVEPIAAGQEMSGNVPVQILRTAPAQTQIYLAQLEAIRRARSYIYIENCYMADDRILYELCRARKRGVDVRVIFPGVVNHKIMESSNRIAVNTLLRHGVKVYIYPGMSHVKAGVYDGWACVGTANFDKLSLQVNRELNLATSHPDTVKSLMEILLLPDFEKSVPVEEPFPLEFTDHLIELLADET
jgi:cardiolipin synthase